MPDDSYTLGDLARLADVTPRTVRYYVAQGLLPGPESAGPATRYGEGHLARLRLIRRLQREHLPLAEIRLRLERLPDEEIIATVSALEASPPAPAPAPEPGGTLAYVRSLMARTGVRPAAHPSAAAGPRIERIALRHALADTADAMAPAPPAPHAPADMPPPLAAAAPAARHPDPAPSMLAADAPPPRSGADRSTWERIVLAPDVELHVRRPLDRLTNKRVERLERLARELLDAP